MVKVAALTAAIAPVARSLPPVLAAQPQEPDAHRVAAAAEGRDSAPQGGENELLPGRRAVVALRAWRSGSVAAAHSRKGGRH